MEDMLGHHDSVWREGERGQHDGTGVVVAGDGNFDDFAVDGIARGNVYRWRGGLCGVPRRVTWIAPCDNANTASSTGIVGYYQTSVIPPGAPPLRPQPLPRGTRRILKSSLTGSYVNKLTTPGNSTPHLRGKVDVAVLTGGVGRSQVRLACARVSASAAGMSSSEAAAASAASGRGGGQDGCRAVAYLPSWINKVARVSQKCGKCAEQGRSSWLAQITTCADFENPLNDAGGVFTVCLRPGCDPRLRIERAGASH